MSVIPNTVNEFLAALDHVMAVDPAVLTWHHPRFGEFAARWVTARSLNHDWRNLEDLRLAFTVLEEMGGFDEERSIYWLYEHSWKSGCDVREVLDYQHKGPNALREADEAHRRYERPDGGDT
jgi:hypothetical protein